jgi:hypothetical protein
VLISHQKKFALFLPWKTASQTALLRLKPYDESPYDKFFHFNKHLNRVVHQHITCADFVCLPEGRLGYFTASFVRNPYDRAYSGFQQLQLDIKTQPSSSYPEPWIRDLVTKQLAENSIQLSAAKFDFNNWLELVGDDQIYEAGRNTNFPLHPSHYWTHLAGQQYVNFVGRVENFEADFQVLLSHINIQATEPVNLNVVDLAGASSSNPFGYRYVDRMDTRSIQKINRLFKQDFDLFKYERI